MLISGADAANAAGVLFDALHARPPSVSLRAHPVLEDAVLRATKRVYGSRWKFTLDGYGAPLRGASAALWAATRAPVPAVEPPMIF